ncbi:MAG: glycogen/starch synthase [Chitinophagaceae bacterium]
MEIIHVSAECYPVAKAGGLGDVVGALPKYQNKLGHTAKVVMPMYRTKFLYENEWETVHEGGTYLGSQWFRYAVIKETTNKLGFELYLVDINGMLDREQVYGYSDDTERFVAFQIAVLHWISQWKDLPDMLHCHDHHTALIPFMVRYCYGIDRLRNIRTTLTIHNGQYQGWMGWDKSNLIPAYDVWKSGLLEWNYMINPLACGVRCADAVTTVSNSYLEELRYSANGLEKLFEYEKGKCVGILNGIDNEVWDPATDQYLEHHFNLEDVNDGKAANKWWLCERFKLEADKPLIIFIGRLVGEKAAEILPQAIGESILLNDGNVNFLVLGSGDTSIESQLQNMVPSLKGKFNCFIGYNEQLAHRMYAGADFLLMPSRVEPCGLNQMYALRYGTVPMVRRTGGLKDTVKDISEPDDQGFGLCFNEATAADVIASVERAVGWYMHAPEILSAARKRMMVIDHSWESSAQAYIEVYGMPYMPPPIIAEETLAGENAKAPPTKKGINKKVNQGAANEAASDETEDNLPVAIETEQLPGLDNTTNVAPKKLPKRKKES